MQKDSLSPKSKINLTSSKMILLGYCITLTLFSTVLYIDYKIQKGQLLVIDSSVISTQKMSTITKLIETARKRVNLSHHMLDTEDVFEKDEISMTISALGKQFITNYSYLHKQNLLPKEKQILDDLDIKFEIVRQKLRQVAELALEDNEETNNIAREIILKEIVPEQQVIVDGFMSILSDTQQHTYDSRAVALIDYQENNFKRNILIILMFFASLIVIVSVLKRITSVEAQLHSLSLIDALTGIPNRRSFDMHLDMVWQICLRKQKPLSLILIDIDYFKKYNDFYGHQQGDICLSQVASIIKQVSNRTYDLAARYGGEEFAIILPEAGEDDVKLMANKLIKQINSENIPHEKSEIANHITLSLGIITRIPTVDSNVSELIKLADQGLYLSKERGRNQVNSPQTK
ncbi:MAG: GGDEF domain-containing protein [Gammaproteobacteria bacterium]|nr:GGDEF domain-containing protein [Gammaproteobacteria bacterium]